MAADDERVAIVATVLNERASLDRFLRGVEANLDGVDEVVIVDGGSSDGTWELLQEWARGHDSVVKLISSPGSGIAAGRNLAMETTTADRIAVTDAGCEARAGWVDAITAPLGDEAIVAVKGSYVGRGTGALGRAVAAVLVNDARTLERDETMPSSRSLAVRRSAWRAVGGYPEWLATAEDTLFAQRLASLGGLAFAPEAVVEWSVTNRLRPLLRQYARYGFGDARAGTNTRRMGILGLLYLLAGLSPVAQVARLAAAGAHGAYLWRRTRGGSRLRGLRFAERPLAIAVIWASDLALVGGFVAGTISKRRRTAAG